VAITVALVAAVAITIVAGLAVRRGHGSSGPVHGTVLEGSAPGTEVGLPHASERYVFEIDASTPQGAGAVRAGRAAVAASKAALLAGATVLASAVQVTGAGRAGAAGGPAVVDAARKFLAAWWADPLCPLDSDVLGPLREFADGTAPVSPGTAQGAVALARRMAAAAPAAISASQLLEPVVTGLTVLQSYGALTAGDWAGRAEWHGRLTVVVSGLDRLLPVIALKSVPLSGTVRGQLAADVQRHPAGGRY
jgi:hypothetical protein